MSEENQQTRGRDDDQPKQEPKRPARDLATRRPSSTSSDPDGQAEQDRALAERGDGGEHADERDRQERDACGWNTPRG